MDSLERTCLTCANSNTSGGMDAIPAGCWTCSSSHLIGGRELPQWKPIEMKNIPYVHSVIREDGIVTYNPPKPATDSQVGGNHYKDLAIQPTEYIHKNKLGFCEGNVVKYITRWKLKGGVQDLNKVIHYVELLKEFEGLE